MICRPTLLALAVGMAGSGAALAQSSDRPYYVGILQDFRHQTNVLNGSGAGEVSDTVFTTTLRGGLNVPFGRQRVYANASLNHQRYSDLDARNSSGYNIGAGLDWSTIERLSGSVVLNANRRQADFNQGGIVPVSISNLERSDELAAKVRLGVVTMLAFEGGVGQRRVSFSAPEFASRQYTQDNASLGVSYRPSAILTLGTGLSGDRTRYRAPAPFQTVADRSQRQDIYATAYWVPTGASTVNARVNVGKTEYDRATAADFEGITGFLAWAWKPTGRLDVTTTLSRETGLDSGFLRTTQSFAVSATSFTPATIINVSATDFSQVTNALSVRAGYELTGKIVLSGGLVYARRTLVDGFTGVGGNDNTTTLALGARYAATRTLSFGCDASTASRSASGVGSSAYDSNSIGCFGQLMLD